MSREAWKAAYAALSAIEKEREALLAPTDAIYAAAQAELAEIEEKTGNWLGNCVACAEPVFEGEPYHHGAEEIQCQECAPTYQDMLTSPQFFVSFETDDHMTPEQAKEVVDAHVAAGGLLTDKMVSV